MFKDNKYSVISKTYITPFFRLLLLSTSNNRMSEGTFCRVEVQIGNHMSRVMKKPTKWFLKRSDTNWPVQSQKKAGSLNFRIKEEMGLYYLCSERKSADQLCHCTADLCLCFYICRLLVF